MQSIGLPKEANFALTKAISSPAKPQILRYRADNSTHTVSLTGTDKIIIEIPTGSNQLLFPKDSWVDGKIAISSFTSSGTSQVNLDQSIYSIINRVVIRHGSSVVEDVQRAGDLFTVLYDIQRNASERAGDTINLLVYEDISGAADSTSALMNPYTLGTLMLITNSAGTSTFQPTLDFSFQIPSGLLGTLAQKAIPLWRCSGASIYLEIELNSSAVAMINTSTQVSALSYQVTDVYYNAKVSTLDQSTRAILDNMMGDVVHLPSVSYRVDPKVLSSGNSIFNDKFGFSFSSVKNFGFWFHNSTSSTAQNCRSISARPHAYLSSHWLEINGERYPNNPINSLSRAYMETMRAFGATSDTNNGGIMNYKSYGNNDLLTATDDLNATNGWVLPLNTAQKRFAAFIDLDRYTGNSTETLLSGTSTVGLQVSLNCEFSTAVAESIQVIGACMYDVDFKIVDGVMQSIV